MSYDTFRDNNENKNEGTTPPASPYGQPQAPQQPQHPNPYGYGAAPQQPLQGAPYQTPPQPLHGSPYDQYQQAPQAGGFNIFGLTWAKNVIPNPATNGMPPTAQKSNVVAYVLWFFLGFLGVHQFYLGNTNRGLFNLALFGVTFLVGLTGIPVGLIYTAYWIYEAVTLNDQTHEINRGLLRKSIL